RRAAHRGRATRHDPCAVPHAFRPARQLGDGGAARVRAVTMVSPAGFAPLIKSRFRTRALRIARAYRDDFKGGDGFDRRKYGPPGPPQPRFGGAFFWHP